MGPKDRKFESGSVEFAETGPASSTISTAPPDFSRAVYPKGGPIAEFIEFAQELCESADVYIVGSLLPALAALIARRCYFDFGDKKIFPNVFAILVGQPGDRKSSAIGLVERLIARRLLPPNRFLPENVSIEALFDEYDEASGGCPDKILIADDANPLFANWAKAGYGDPVGKRFLTLHDCKGLSESFRRNREKSETSSSRRYIEETSTSMVLGATFNIAQFQTQQEARTGFQRRFLYYVARDHGRFIPIPKRSDLERLTPILRKFEALTELEGEFRLSDDAEKVWLEFQRSNREQLKEAKGDITEEALAARLNSEPTHALKIAMIFEAVRAVQDSRNGALALTIGVEMLQCAIEHVQVCMLAADKLDTLGHIAEITNDADLLYERVRQDYSDRATGYNAKQDRPQGSITVSRSELTLKFCHHSSRRGALTPQILYHRIIPNLVERARVIPTRLPLKTGQFFLFLRAPD